VLRSLGLGRKRAPLFGVPKRETYLVVDDVVSMSKA
jgi:hypothetical protein